MAPPQKCSLHLKEVFVVDQEPSSPDLLLFCRPSLMMASSVVQYFKTSKIVSFADEAYGNALESLDGGRA